MEEKKDRKKGGKKPNDDCLCPLGKMLFIHWKHLFPLELNITKADNGSNIGACINWTIFCA